MIVVLPTTLAAIMALKPTDPAPNTAIEEPGLTLREFMTPPAPVCTPHPSGASFSRGTSLLTRTTFLSVMRACDAKEDWPKKDP